MPLLIAKGNSTAQGYGVAASSAAATYIENLFSTYLYTGLGPGSGTEQTITNGIDLSTKGGMTWIKWRANGSSQYHALFDTARGATKFLSSNATDASTTASTSLTSFNTNGFSLGQDASYGYVNASTLTYASWTFRKQEKFFDIVTYTGTGANRTISHNLGSVPGCIIVKRTDTTGAWQVYHGSLANTQYMVLNTTAAVATGTTRWNSTTPTSAVFSVGTDATVNASGGTYVAYLFASNAGGFGNAGTDNVITCGSFTADDSASATVNLGYEPQWVLWKLSNGTGNGWYVQDTMRGFNLDLSNEKNLLANSANAEDYAALCYPTATGFVFPSTNGVLNAGSTVIYIAIRRGTMKTPTDATRVFSPVIYTSPVSSLNTNIVADLSIQMQRDNGGQLTEGWTQDRLRGVGGFYHYVLATTSTIQEEYGNISGSITNFGLSQYSVAMVSTNQGNAGASGKFYVDWLFARAAGFFDEVCYTGTGTYPFTINHNLGVVPELMIFKARSATNYWYTYAKPLTSPNANWYQNYMSLNVTTASNSDTTSFTTAPTSTTITAASYFAESGTTYVAYLFATVAGVSKVGTFTGTGGTQTINCGFGAGGARWLLVKRTDSTGNWYVFDSARGFTSSSSPYLLLNSTAAETTGNNGCYAASTGFTVTSTASATVNINGASYIFLAIA